METQITNVVGVQVLCPKLFGDNRGSFMELWNETQLKQVVLFLFSLGSENA